MNTGFHLNGFWILKPAESLQHKAGLASRNTVHLQKRSFYVVSTSAFIFFILYVKPIRSLLIQRTPAGSSFRLLA